MIERERCYDLFGLPPGASVEEIRREYRRLVMSWHPDRLERAAPEIRAQATAYLQELNAAYRRLTSPDPRRSPSGHRGLARAGSVWTQSAAPHSESYGLALCVALILVLLGVALFVLAIKG